MTAVGSLDIAKHAILRLVVVGRVFDQSRSFYGRGAILWCRNPLLTSDNYLRKTEWLVTNVTAVGSPGRAELAILGIILVGRVFGQFRTYLWSLSHFVM